MRLYVLLRDALRDALNESPTALGAVEAEAVAALVAVELERARLVGDSPERAKESFLSFCSMAWDSKVKSHAAHLAAAEAVRAADKEAMH
jgi:hypothetical protein